MSNLQRLSRIYRDMQSTMDYEIHPRGSRISQEEDGALRHLATALIHAHQDEDLETPEPLAHEDMLFSVADAIATSHGETTSVKDNDVEMILTTIYKLDGIDTHMFSQDVVDKVKAAMHEYELAKEERLKQRLQGTWVDNDIWTKGEWGEVFGVLALDLYTESGDRKDTLHKLYTTLISLLDINDL